MLLKIDDRIRTVLENGLSLGHRSLVVLVGETSKDMVPYIHQILGNACLKKISILWCYKKELSLSSSRKKRMRQIKKKDKEGEEKNEVVTHFENFVSSTNIKYCYYKETYKILGNTYKMCVLQDFEGVTANILCRVIETVEGGGSVVLLLQSLDSLKQMYTLFMDVNSRYRSFKHSTIVPRFNERLIHSLKMCKSCIVIDDKLKVLEHSQHISKIEKLQHSLTDASTTKDSEVLTKIKKSVQNTPPMGVLVNLCKTVDQASVLLQFSVAITKQTLDQTISLTAARGRGKSATMGLAVVGAIAFEYSRIYVTSPSPENLVTFFEFAIRGLQALNYSENCDYTVKRSALHNNCIVKIEVTRDGCNKFIQYISPTKKLGTKSAEILVVDEAAALPLPIVKSLLGPYLVFLSSTISGYEGTGRALSLKLLAEIREGKETGRSLVELKLEESIRYKPGDPVENWLSDLLCLEPIPSTPPSTLPPPDECALFSVDRDMLFNSHPVSERLLSELQSLLVSSHYRNCPDDLQQLSDAPAHRLFLLMPPPATSGVIPPIFVVIQVVLEGGLGRSYVQTQLQTTDGHERPAGDLIPWTISNAMCNPDFARLCGGRILRIATHPSLQGKGYGSRAISLLKEHYKKVVHLADTAGDHEEPHSLKIVSGDGVPTLSAQSPCPPKSFLLAPVGDQSPDPVHYLGVAFGVTPQLLKFWKRAGFTQLYMGQVSNALTGEHTTLMVCPLSTTQWLEPLWISFRETQLRLLGTKFRHLPCDFALSLVSSKKGYSQNKADALLSVRTSGILESLDSIELFIRRQCEAFYISFLLTDLAKLYFSQSILNCKLTTLQTAILMGVGIQGKTESLVAQELGIDTGEIIKQKHTYLRSLLRHLTEMKEMKEEEGSISMLDDQAKRTTQAVMKDMLRDDDQEEEVKQFVKKMKRQAGGDSSDKSKRKMLLDVENLKSKKVCL